MVVIQCLASYKNNGKNNIILLSIHKINEFNCILHFMPVSFYFIVLTLETCESSVYKVIHLQRCLTFLNKFIEFNKYQ